MITDFSKKKLVEYLKPGQKVLIRFGHGLGDTILFIPLFEKLKQLYPQVHFDLYVESGQEEIWESIKDKDALGYDLVFSLDFPMSEGSKWTKPELCCVNELGIEPMTALAKLPQKPSPFVALHFQGTALPDSVNFPEEIAHQIWEEVKESGKIPIECHFEHVFHNPRNMRYSFIDNSVRNYKANLSNLFGLLQHSFAFIGIASGPFIAALSIMPERTFFLESSHRLSTYTKAKIPKINLQDWKPGLIKQWLEKLKKS